MKALAKKIALGIVCALMFAFGVLYLVLVVLNYFGAI